MPIGARTIFITANMLRSNRPDGDGFCRSNRPNSLCSFRLEITAFESSAKCSQCMPQYNQAGLTGGAIEKGLPPLR
jgi:hypothetical protein